MSTLLSQLEPVCCSHSQAGSSRTQHGGLRVAPAQPALLPAAAVLCVLLVVGHSLLLLCILVLLAADSGAAVSVPLGSGSTLLAKICLQGSHWAVSVPTPDLMGVGFGCPTWLGMLDRGKGGGKSLACPQSALGKSLDPSMPPPMQQGTSVESR